MTAYTLSANTNIDSLTAKAGGDTYNTNGFNLTIDQDSRTGLNQTTSTTLGTITISATLGGNVNIDGTAVRLIPFNTGAGNVPAWNTVITKGSASGLLIGVYANFTSASTATGAAMPASGYLKIKQWNGIAYTAGALGGISATATGPDTVGWLEIVGDESAVITCNRLGQCNITGAWFSIGTTNGSSNQTLQIPNNGLSRYVAGVFIEQNAGAGDYEFYPNAGTTTTTGTEAQRGKVVWIDATGLVRIGNSGAATNGYTPASGLAIVIGNVFLENSTTSTRTANTIPNATVTTRHTFTTTGGGVISIDKTSCAWYGQFTQPFSLSITNSSFVDAILLDEIASPIAFSKVGVGNKPTTALLTSPLTMTLCYEGGTFTDCVWARVSQASSGSHTLTLTDIAGFTFLRNTVRANTIRGNATTYAVNATRNVNCAWTNCTFIQGPLALTTCTNVNTSNLTYIDCVSANTLTTTSVAGGVWNLFSNTNSCVFSGLNLPITNTQPYATLMNLGAAGCSNIKLRNIGTYASPLSLGSSNSTGLIYTAVASAAAANIYVQQVYVSNIRTNTMTADNSSILMTEESVFGDYADAPLMVPLNFKRKGCGCTVALTAQTAVYGTHWWDCFTSTTVGRIGLMMNESNTLTASLITLSGGAAFTSAGGLYMPTIGQVAIFETPNYIIGHTGFSNSSPVMAGGTIGNYTLQYQIDKNDGNGYGTLTTMSGANLSSISGISASLGFKMKWKITTSTTNATAITSLYVLTTSTTTTQAYQYPLDLVPVSVTVLDTLGNPIQNARVAIFFSSNSSQITDQLTNSGGQITTSASYTGDAALDIRVRKSNSGETRYINNDSVGTLTSLGFSATVVMIQDTIASP